MRLFVAVTPPPEALDHLEAAVAAVRVELGDAADPALRWARRDSWHLTLAFLGEVPDDRVPDVRRRQARAARRHPRCRLALRGAGRFDGRVLWVGVSGDVGPLRRLAASVAAGARRAGVDVDTRPLRPHLTIARAREPVDLRPAVTAVDGYEGPAWTAEETLLVRSRLGAGPGRTAVHEVIDRCSLRG